MKKIIKISLLTTIFINFSIKAIFAEELYYIKDSLESLGVSEEYSQSVVNYIENLKITASDFDEIISDSVDVYNNFNEKNKDGVTLSELLTIYDDINKIADSLKLDVRIDIINKELEIKSKDTNEVIFKVDKDDAVEYYNNFKELAINEDEYYDFLENIKENIIVKDQEFKDDNKDNITLYDEENKYENNFSSDTRELLKKTSDDSSILVENKEETQYIETTESVTDTDINVIQNRRIYGSVFIVLTGCVILAIILGAIFKMK